MAAPFMNSLLGMAAAAALFVHLASNTALAQLDARMIQQPAVSERHIAFSYAGDIWIVPKEGGIAHRLTSAPGQETFPRFSPDGNHVAFTGNYDGNTDVYVIPTKGGDPLRITHHPAADRSVDWYPDGRSLLFASARESGVQRFNQFYKVAREGGMPEKLPLAYAEYGSISPDGKKIAFQTVVAPDTWKRYRGGNTPVIWTLDFETLEAAQVDPAGANDSFPMWNGNRIYFLSDRDPNMRGNIWMFDPENRTSRQITRFETVDVHHPSMGPSEIVFQAGGKLHLLNLESEQYAEVPVQVVSDQISVRPRSESATRWIQSVAISPNGKRAVFEARGDLFSIPAEHGPVLNLSQTSGAAERSPAWSPDGKWIAYFTDRPGEYELAVRAADGTGEERILTKLGPGFRYRPVWSPDSTRLVFIDQTLAIQMVRVPSGEVTRVDQVTGLTHSGLSRFVLNWSPDSRWIAYAKLTENRNDAVFVYDTESSEIHQLTSGFYSDNSPVFDPDGKYLYFLSGRALSPIYDDDGYIGSTWVYANRTRIVAAPLTSETASPLAPRNDDEEDSEVDKKETGKENKDSEKNGEAGSESESDKSEPTAKEDKEKKDKKPKAVRIDIAGFEQRAVQLPPKAGNYADLQAISGQVLYLRRPRTGSGDENASVIQYDLKEREEKTIVREADSFVLSAKGTKLLVRHKENYAIVDPKPDQNMDKRLRTSEMVVSIDPRAEWNQIFNDVWRLFRDYFYDPDMHGVDWEDIRSRYRPLLEAAATRWDLNHVIAEMIGELNASHAYRMGGDTESARNRNAGLLGADFALENGAFRITRIVRGAAWDDEARSPLSEPGVNVREGDYLLAVNGVPIDTTRDVFAAFQGLGGKAVLLTVNDRPEMEGARRVLVTTLENESRLRNLAWIEKNRKRVEEASGGRIGYIYVPNTGANGQTELFRQFRAQFHLNGLIIDERFNAGGQWPDRFVELMGRRRTGYVSVRESGETPMSLMSRLGAQAMLINSRAGSGGDLFPYLFKEAELGPLIGTRTAGALIGISGVPALVDGGQVAVPTLGCYGADGEWLIEGHGVEPDLPVIDDPGLMARGTDPQLERGIQEVLRLLESNKSKSPPRPSYRDLTVQGLARGATNAAVELRRGIEAIFNQAPDSPGYAVAVVKEGEVLYKGAFGMADLEQRIPITTTTVFDTASVSKQFTGMAIAMLIEQGKVSLDDDVRKHLPKLPDFGSVITVGHLVFHTSGLRDWPTLFALSGRRLDEVISFQEILRQTKQQKELNFTPGSEYLYSNTGYNLLALIIERIGGEPFAKWIDENLLQPVGMKESFFLEDHQRVIRRRAHSYEEKKGEFRNVADQLTALGSSSLFSTVEDLARWLVHLQASGSSGCSVVKRFREGGKLTDGSPAGYAFGMATGRFHGFSFENHSGSYAGYRTFLEHYPEEKLGIVVLANFSSAQPMQKARQIAALLLRPAVETAAAEPSRNSEGDTVLELAPDELKSFVGDFHSSELETTYRIRIREGKLVAEHSRNGPVSLTPRGENAFTGNSWYFHHVTFRPDEAGTMKEMRVGSGRTRNVRFMRVDWEPLAVKAESAQP
jgi:tricorn protease